MTNLFFPHFLLSELSRIGQQALWFDVTPPNAHDANPCCWFWSPKTARAIRLIDFSDIGPGCAGWHLDVVEREPVLHVKARDYACDPRWDGGADVLVELVISTSRTGKNVRRSRKVLRRSLSGKTMARRFLGGDNKNDDQPR